jgi:hypothetical protein
VERTHGQMQREMMENNDNNTTMTQTDDWLACTVYVYM